MAQVKTEVGPEGPQLVNVSEFIVEWIDRLDIISPEAVSRDKFIGIVSKKINVDKEMAKELDNVCNLSSLTCDGEPPGVFGLTSGDRNWKDIPDTLTNLVTLNLLREGKEMCRTKRQKEHKALKYKQLDAPWLHEIKHRLHRHENLPVPRDAIITIQVYEPYPAGKGLKLGSELQVLGEQSLCEVRDNITCRLDHIVPGELSEHPDIPGDLSAKENFPSGFLYVEGVFYNDMRHPNSRDYSLVIRDWAAQDPERGLGPYTTAKMEDTTLDMMSFQLGKPYVYLHHGSCEHLVVFTDIRLAHPEDCLKVEEYPIVVSKYYPKPNKCRVCLKNKAVWLTQSSPHAPEDPCFFCDTCFRMLHYDASGTKIGDFRAFSCKGVI